MNNVAALLRDIDISIGRGVGGERALSAVTELFLSGGGRREPDHVALFDAVLQRFARGAAPEHRAALAHQLLRSPNPPPDLVRTLAHDEIMVAGPILSRLAQFDEKDLMAVALTKGRDHLLAICDRSSLSTPVTDLLVSRGDPIVNRAAAGNAGARFSELGVEVLLEQAEGDVALQSALGDRRDLSKLQVETLISVTRSSAWRKVASGFQIAPEGEVAATLARPRRAAAAAAQAAIARLAETGLLTEAQLGNFAREGRPREAVTSLALLADLPDDYVEGLFGQRDNDMLLVVARSCNCSWPTAQALLQLRDPSLRTDRQFWHASEIFNSMPISTAKQTAGFIRARSRPAKPPEPTRGRRLRFG